ncbi:hypothetical protein [Candidatus Laterigemmans baculatus]|uniref:hypothetical protein n=1 Tax=Candidatus Laterigemmans baculatus TaxID=2770505 RepID=UPI0013DA3353|nr:hypothetical protein [Candidatus Laterigemmans baculatus]
MAEHPLARPPQPLAPLHHEEHESSAVEGVSPDGEAPTDPAAKALTRGCLMMWLIVGVVGGTASLIYWFFFT